MFNTNLFGEKYSQCKRFTEKVANLQLNFFRVWFYFLFDSNFKFYYVGDNFVLMLIALILFFVDFNVSVLNFFHELGGKINCLYKCLLNTDNRKTVIWQK